MNYDIVLTSAFKKQIKKLKKQNKDLTKLTKIVDSLAGNEKLPSKNKDHRLIDDEKHNNCRECHIEPDWLLIYKKNEDMLILLLIETGSHSDLF